MITFIDVSGPCLIEDGIQSRSAESGLSVPHYGEKCLVATGDGGRAKFTVNGRLVELPPNSYIVVRPQGSRVYSHKSNTKDFQLWCGRIWSTVLNVMGGPRYERIDSGNAVAGVRG